MDFSSEGTGRRHKDYVGRVGGVGETAMWFFVKK